MTKNLRIRQTLWSLNLRTPKIANGKVRTKRLQLSNMRFSRPERFKVRASVPSLPTGRCHTLPYICHSASVVSTYILLLVHEFWILLCCRLCFHYLQRDTKNWFQQNPQRLIGELSEQLLIGWSLQKCQWSLQQYQRSILLYGGRGIKNLRGFWQVES